MGQVGAAVVALEVAAAWQKKNWKIVQLELSPNLLAPFENCKEMQPFCECMHANKCI